MKLSAIVSQLLSAGSDRKKLITTYSADILEILNQLKAEYDLGNPKSHQATYTSILADVALCIPHIRGFVRENLITQLGCLELAYAANCDGEKDLAVFSLISQHICALRLLCATTCLDSDEHRLNIDLGCLISLQSIASAEVRYHSISLTSDLLQLPQAFKINALQIAMQGLVSNGLSADELLAELMNKDTELFRLDVDVDDAVPRSLTPAHSVDNALETAISLRPLNLPTVKVAGYSLPTKLLSTDVWSSKMIMTSTTLRNVQRLAQAVALDVPVIVQGEVGCGKSFLVKELAAVMGQESTLVDLHLDDQTDSKTLIGAYVCSDVPGEFLWQPGVVTQAAMKGRWLVIEDIDRVPLEVAASLSALLERKRLYLPDRGREVPVHPSFRIFGTRSVAHSDAASTSSHTSHSMLTVPSLRHFSYLWHFVSIEVPTTEEIELIITTRFPSLLPVVVNKLIETYMLFGGRSMHVDAHAHDVAIELDPVHSDSALPGQLNAIAKRFSRQFTLRDLMKAARRCERYRGSFNVVSGLLTDELRRNLLCEIVDVFAAAMRDSNAFVEVVRALGRCWGVADCDIEGAVFMAQPQLHHNATSDQASDKVSAAGTMTIGRVVIPIASTDAEKLPIQQFAFTKYSLRMLERVAACVSMGESVLLVGETGAGKTTSVQELANLTHRKLIVQNLSLSTDASDLLGGYRPVTLRQLFLPSYERFLDLFADTFSSSQNSEFVTIVAQTFRKQQWKKLLKAFQKASDNAMKKIQQQAISDSSDSSKGKFVKLQQDWKEFSERSARFEANLPRIEVGFAFAFVDGLLVDAMRRGHWVLLDEINLAAPETLQALVGVLDGQSLCMTERGDTEPVPRHPDFRLFAAMNPPTDVGKRELPIALRSRFTELYCEELTDPQDLRQVVERVLSDDGSVGGTMTEHVDDIVSVYLGCRASADVNLVDGSGQRPRFSLRSLTRSLRASKAFMDIGLRPFNRTLFEGFLLNFQTLLDGNSRNFMWTFLRNSLNVTGNTKELAQPPQRPGGKKLTADDWVLVKPFWLRTGKLTPVDWAAKDSRGITKFVLTATVDAAVRNLAAAIAAGVAPVLLQGPTSVGKTSMIEYLAARTGHKCVRINNHEHTDVQEYVGGYVTNQQGHLEFRDGLLVDALRNGHWIILDELNLAPSDVLEALNRLLDDNKELLIPETGEIVRPSQGFTLFATQNPAGAYGGRKPLSRAFRNRFLELNVSDLPSSEIEEIITQSCGIAPKFSKMLVGVMNELQTRRQQSHLFQGKYGAITTRDLIKWGKRLPQSAVEVAAEGFMMLAERLRNDDEKATVLEVLNKICKSQLDPTQLYEMKLESNEKAANKQDSSVTGGDLSELVAIQEQLRQSSLDVEGVRGVAITTSLRRMWKLTGRCVAHDEPALLIGETGCGKTMVCQLLAAHRNQKIRILNCHQSTETADIIGGLRPVRGRAQLLAKSVNGICEALRLMSLSGMDVQSPVSSEAELLQTARRIADSNLREESHDNANTGTMEGKEDNEVDETSFDDAEVKQALDELQVVVDNVMKGEIEAATAALARLETAAAAAAEEESMMSPKKKTKREKKAIPASASTSTSNPAQEVGKKYATIIEAIERAKNDWQRSKTLFEWHDGPLVTAMKEGDMFLLDEINLAEDAVIERINSVLESSREITLAEKGGIVTEKIIAHPNFKFLATMNPGGDFGKRELSPALRSRFTEIWIPNANSAADITLIVSEILQLNSECETKPQELAAVMVNFMNWLNEIAASTDSEVTMKGIQISVRELLAWARFITQWEPSSRMEAFGALLHGAHMVLLDGLGIGQSVPRETVWALKHRCVERLLEECPVDIRYGVKERVYLSDARMSGSNKDNTSSQLEKRLAPVFADGRFELKGSGFSVPLGPNYAPDDRTGARSYVLNARSVTENLCRIMRAMQLPRPILLEGPPGVGKSSIISNLAKLTGHNLVRINLSEHSEISDLLGSDLPAPTDYSSDEGQGSGAKRQSGASSGPKFCWCDGVFLTALKRGDWVLLDELNLAPQSVLEGLNACLDHRGEVFLPEIGRSFYCPPSFRVFCAQNPAGEGGGRKGLPQSFLTRFSRVFVEAMDEEDMREISMQAFVPAVKVTNRGDNQLEDLVRLDYLATTDGMLGHYIPQMVRFIQRLQSDIVDKSLYGGSGAPWEFNLRDIFRWCELVKSLSSKLTHSSSAVALSQCVINESAYLLFSSRMRTQQDRDQLAVAFSDVFGWHPSVELYPPMRALKASHVVIGSATLPVHCHPRLAADISDGDNVFNKNSVLQTLGGLSKTVETLAHCVSLQWPILLVGSSGTGKRRCIRQLAALTGNAVVEFSATSSTDSTELLGAFEQASAYRHLRCGVEYLEKATLPLSLPAMSKKQKQKSPASTFSYLTAAAHALSLLSQVHRVVLTVTESNTLRMKQGKDLFDLLQQSLAATWAAASSLPSSTGAGVDVSKIQAYLTSSRSCFDHCYAECNISSAAEAGSSASSSLGSGFEWVDGVVVRALEEGHWLLIDNVNLCSASVLDRLNSLLEPGGSLLLTETGAGRVVTPHPDFRVFLCMDPSHGEISRAMRNRCVEVSMYFCPDLDAAAARTLLRSDLSPLAVRSEPSSSDPVMEALRYVYTLLEASSDHQTLDTTKSRKKTSGDDKDKKKKKKEVKSSVPITDGNDFVHLPPGMPRMRLFSRLIRLAVLEQRCGRSAPEAVARAIRAVLPMLESVALAASRFAAITVGNSLSSALVKQKSSWLSSIHFLPAEVFAGLRLVAMTKHLNNHNTKPVSTSIAEDWRWLLAASKSSRDRAKAEKRTEPDIDVHLASLSLANAPTDPTIKPEATLRELALESMTSYDESMEEVLSGGQRSDDSHTVAKAFAMAHLVAAVVSHEEWVGHLVAHTLRASGFEEEAEVFVHYLRMLTTSDELEQRDVHRGPEVTSFWHLVAPSKKTTATSLSKSLIHHLLDIRRRQHIGHLASIVAMAELHGTSNVKSASLDDGLFSGDACWALLDMLVLSRLSIIQEEHSQRKGVDDALSLSLASSGSSMTLWAVGYAVNRGRLVAESRDLQVLSALHSVLSAVNGAIRNTAAALISSGNSQAPDEHALQALDLVVKRRDMLSKTLLLSPLPEQGDLGSSLSLPWEPIIVCISWIKKALAVLSRGSTASIASYHNDVLRGSSGAVDELRNFDKAMAEYWRRPSFDTSLQGGGSSGHAKLRLWKEGGHAAVPASAGKWAELRAVRSIVCIDDCDGGMLQLPNFVDTQVGRMDILTSQRARRSLASMSLLKEWVSLYSTFYWAHTDESAGGGSSKVMDGNVNMNMADLADALRVRFEEYRRNRNRKPPMPLIGEGDMEVSSDALNGQTDRSAGEDASGRVKEEWALAGELSLTLLSEPLVLTYILRISSALAEVLQRSSLSVHSLSKKRTAEHAVEHPVLTISDGDIEKLRSLVTATMAAAVRYTLYDITELRELQTLLWSTEAVLDSRRDVLRLDTLLSGKGTPKLKAAQQADLTKKRAAAADLLLEKERELVNLARNFIVQLDMRLGQMAARSLFGGIDTVEFHYGSRTLSSALESDPGMENSNMDDDIDDQQLHWLVRPDGSSSTSSALVTVPWTWALFTGFARLLQPTALELALKHVDICVVSPQILGAAGLGARGKSSMGLLTNGVASVTVSSSRSAQRKLLQLFRLSVATANSRDSFSGKKKILKAKSLASLCRLPLLGQYALDVIISNRDFYTPQLIEEMSTLFLNSTKVRELAITRKLFNSLVELNIPSKCASHFIADIFAKCLVPVLTFLAENYPITDKEGEVDDLKAVDAVSIGAVWVKIGLLRLHLSVPMTPIDPATKSAVKAGLLSRDITTLRGRIQVSHWHATLSGGPTIPPEAGRAVAEMRSAENRVAHLTARAIQRPTDAASFEDLFFEIRSACDGLADITRILTLQERIENSFSSLRTVFLTAQRPKCKETDQQLLNSATEAFNELLACGQEELGWQGSMTAFAERCKHSFDAYEDIYSPLLSAAMNISTGLRIVISWCTGQAEDMISVLNTVLGPNRDKNVPRKLRFNFALDDADQTCDSATTVVSDGWRSLMVYPHSSYIRLNDMGGSITKAALAAVKDLLLTSDTLVSRAAKCLEDANAASESSGTIERNRLPRPDAVRSSAPRHTLLLILSKLDYLVGGGVVAPSTAGNLFGAVLSRFVQEHLNAEEERKRKEAIKAATYRNKMQEKTFESDPEKEELAALRIHFPDHLKEFKGVRESARGPDGQILQLGDDEPQEHDDEDVAARAVDEKTTAMLVGYHSRMVFLHFMQQLRAAGILWLKSDTQGSAELSLDGTEPDNLHLRHRKVSSEALVAQRESLANVLAASSLMAAKSLDRGLQRLMVPELDRELRGSALNALATMADCCRSIGLGRSSKSWLTDIIGDIAALQGIKKGKGKAVQTQTNTKIDIDRDFLLLLDPTVQGPWHPSDFHADPNIEEAAQAADPLRRIFDRASDILALFPGNELLVQVCKVSARIAEFAVSTPLGKLLISLQLLLSKAQEWEQFAASHVSLRNEMAAISALIGRWRELELRSWDQLLRCKELAYVTNALNYWFTLARALHTSPDETIIKNDKNAGSSATSGLHSRWPTLAELAPTWLWHGQARLEEVKSVESKPADGNGQKAAPLDENGYLSKIFDVLNTFLSSCIVGEFPARVHLVRLFALQLEQEARLNEQSQSMDDFDSEASAETKHSGDDDAAQRHRQRLKRIQKRVAHVAMGVWRYYEQFVSTVRTFQDTLREPIETRLKGEVKIGKWDQMSTYGLIEHSEKIHRKLNKFIREYQNDVLDYPVAAVLRRSLIGDMASEQGDLKAATVIPSMTTIFPVLKLLNEQLPTSNGASDESKGDKDGEDEEDVSDGENMDEEESQEDVRPSFTDCSELFLDAAALVAEKKVSAEDTLSKSKGDALADSICSRFPKLSRTDVLTRKMDQYLRGALVIPPGRSLESANVARFGYRAAMAAENICDEIFSRINSLRSESVPKSAKHRAVADLLHRLRDEGVSHLRSAAPAEARQSVQLLSLSAVLSCEIAGDLHWNSAAPKGNFEKSERYFIRNVAEIDQLRAQAAAPSAKDVSSREIGLMVALTENLFCSALRSRCALAAGLEDRRSVLALLGSIEEICHVKAASGSDDKTKIGANMAHVIRTQRMKSDYVRRASSIMLDNMLQMRRLLVAARAAHSPENVEEDVPAPFDKNVPCTEAGAVVSVSVVDRAVSAVDSIIARIQALLEKDGNSRDTSSDGARTKGKNSLETYNAKAASVKAEKERAQDLVISASFGGFHLSEESSSLFSSGSIDGSISADDMADAAGTLAIFDDMYDLFCSLVSSDVVVIIRQRLGEYVQTLQSPLVFTSTPSGDQQSTAMNMDIDVESSADSNIDDFDAAAAQAVSAVIDECLVSVQKIRTLAGQVEPVSGSKIPKEGCFGESIEVTGSTRSDAGGESSGNPTGFIGILSLASSSVAATQGHKLSAALNNLRQTLEKLPASGANAQVVREMALSCIRPLILRVLAADAILLRDLCDAFKSTGKLLYVVLRVFRTLLAKGLCSDETKEEEGEGGEGGDAGEMKFEDDVDGTGMGEGEGKKDVSDEIENEEQLLGLKDDKPQDDNAPQKKEKQESKQLKDEEKDKGVEMSQDFDGEMYDLPEEPEDTKDDDGDDEEDEEELEREMGDANPDDIVDEKQWDDKEDELEDNGGDQKEKFEKDSKMDGETLEGETRTKEEEDDDNGEEKGGKDESKKEDEQAGKDNADKQDEGDGDQDNSDGKINEEQEDDVMEKPLGVDVRKEEKEEDSEGEEGDEQGGAPGEDQEQEAGEGENTGDDLPDDMRLDGGSEGGDDDGEGEGGMEEPPIDEDGNEAEGDENKMDDDEQPPEDEDPEGEGMQMSGGGNINEDENKDDDDDEQKDDGDGDNAEEAAKEVQGEVEGQKQEYRAPAFGVQAKGGQDTVLGAEEEKEGTGNADDAQDEADAQAPPPASRDDASKGSDGARQGSGTDGSRESASGPPQEGDPRSRERQPPNPFKQRGDINKAWHRRLNILTPEDQQEGPNNDKNDKSIANDDETQEDGDGRGQYEHTNDEEHRAGDEQVLADVAEEDAVQLPQTGERNGPSDDNQPDDHDTADSAMLDEQKQDEKKSREERKRDRRDEADQGDASDENLRKRAKAESDAAREAKKLAADEDMDVSDHGSDGSNDGDGDDGENEGAEDAGTTEQPKSKEEDVSEAGAKIFTNDMFRREKEGESKNQSEGKKDKDLEEEDYSMEYQEDTAHKEGSSMADARHHWSRQRSATESHAIRLCEQLRLVLEPTLATRLQGDYRTGKRINMRRVVGYVASGFRKDKIWLRRTKPAKREYQVMVMIDNSSSMGEAGPLALSALATLSTALTRLEVGQLCVAAFASDVKIVHPFGQPFDDEAGARALTRFDFAAQRTLLGASLEAVEPIFAAAKAGTSGATGVVSAAGGAVVLQLCFVISDARIDSDNRTRLDRIVRDFADQNVLVVLVIIDRNADPKDSIFNTRSVEFRGDKVVTSSYMDDFPFPYYVAINKLEVLPDVLSDALKQWFEMVGAQLSFADKK